MAKIIKWSHLKPGMNVYQETVGYGEIESCYIIGIKDRTHINMLFDDWNPDGVKALIEYDPDVRYWDAVPTKEERENTPREVE